MLTAMLLRFHARSGMVKVWPDHVYGVRFLRRGLLHCFRRDWRPYKSDNLSASGIFQEPNPKFTWQGSFIWNWFIMKETLRYVTRLLWTRQWYYYSKNPPSRTSISTNVFLSTTIRRVCHEELIHGLSGTKVLFCNGTQNPVTRCTPHNNVSYRMSTYNRDSRKARP